MKSVVVALAGAALCMSVIAIAQPTRFLGTTRPANLSVGPLQPESTPVTEPKVEPTFVTTSAAPLSPSTAAPDPVKPAATIYGRVGSFGVEATYDVDPFVSYQPVGGWGFLPGQAAYFVVVDERGRVVIANAPQTDNQTRPTAVTMAVSIFDPTVNRFNNLVIPTSTGASSAVAIDGSGVGGADVSDLQLIDGQFGQEIVLASVAPYNGWDASRSGVYPTLGVLDERSGSWVPGAVFTGAQLRASSDSGSHLCNRDLPAVPTPVADCWGLNEIGLLPASQLLVGTQYFSEPADSEANGGIAVLSAQGTVVSTFGYPSVSVGGRRLKVHLRELDVDPTGSVGDERFIVVFDVELAKGVSSPFVAQEFRFDAVSSRISAVSFPFVTGGSREGVALGVETAAFDHQGNLWIAESLSNSLLGGRIAVYNRGSSLDSRCAVSPRKPSDRWGTACAPDRVFDTTFDLGLVRSLTEDVVRNRMIAVTMNGSVVVVSSTQSYEAGDLRLDRLVDRNLFWVGPRKGAISPDGSTLWVPIQQLQSPAACSETTCPPVVLDQWLAGLRLDSI